MNTSDHHRQVTDEDLGSFLLELPSSERKRLLTLLASRLDPRTILEPLVEGVTGALAESGGEQITGAEVKEAVRRALVENMQARRTHLAQLAQLAELTEAKGRRDAVARRIADFCRTSGLKKVTGIEDLSLFRVVEGDPETQPHAAVVKPAFVDEATNRLVLAGEVVFSDAPPHKDPGRDEEKAVCLTCGAPLKGRRVGKKKRGRR
ncbi:hypothetical protein [Nocardiopsis sp. FR4]|uniref:hypothetical protein n=1 Tax=Nocardiopsis sp. FR4 TaxID=2605985 RepID=UPI001357C63C|nr:hypothetical protein [Nocardiopsis sp. FR4]